MGYFKQYSVIFALLFVSHISIADDALYDPIAPDGSAFIRVFQSSSTGKSVVIGGKEASLSDRQGLSYYIFLPAGDHRVRGVSGLTTVSLKVGEFYTLLLSPSLNKGFRLVNDQSLNTKTKAMIQLYNLDSSKAVSLKTTNGKVTVIQSTQPGQTGFRHINAVKVPLALFANEKMLEELGNVQLERGKVFNVIYRAGIREPLVLTQASRINTRM